MQVGNDIGGSPGKNEGWPNPERSRGIFLAHRYSVVCVTAEKGKPFAKGARKSRVQGRFLAVLEMTVWGGMGLFHVAYNGYVWKTPFPQRHPERSPRSFLHTGIASYVWQSKIGSLPRKGQGRTECKEDFSTALEMTAWGWMALLMLLVWSLSLL